MHCRGMSGGSDQPAITVSMLTRVIVTRVGTCVVASRRRTQHAAEKAAQLAGPIPAAFGRA
jgi:hypothetical protein